MSETISCCISVYHDTESKNWGLSRIVRIKHDGDFNGYFFNDFQFPSSISVERSKLENEIDKIEKDCEKSKYTVRKYVVSGPKNKDMDKIVKKLREIGLTGRVNTRKPDEMISLIKNYESKKDNNIQGWRSGKDNLDLMKMLSNPEVNDLKYCSKIQGVYFLLNDQPRILKRLF